MNVQTYWQAVRTIAEKLPGDTIWLYPLDSDSRGTHEKTLDSKGDNTGPPQLVEADRRVAAMRLVEKTHRLATKEEVDAHKERQEVASKKNIAKESARAMKNISLSPEQFAQALRGVAPETEKPPKHAA